MTEVELWGSSTGREGFSATATKLVIVKRCNALNLCADSKTINGIITSWSRGAEHLFGYRAEEVVGKPITILIPADRLDEEPAILAKLRDGQKVDHFDTIRRRKAVRSLTSP